MEPSVQLIIICCNEERRRFQKKQMETLGLPYAIFDGYTQHNSKDYITEKHPKCPEPDNQICCLRSHIGAIDHFVKHYSHKDYCIIVEDDVVFVKHIMTELKRIIRLWEAKDIDLISLGYLNPKEKFKAAQSEECLNWQPMDLIWGTQCYIIKRDYATKMAFLYVQNNCKDLFEVAKKMKEHTIKELKLYADVIITGLCKHGFVWPPVAVEYEEFNSIITPKDTNKDRAMFDFSFRSREEFYNPN
jgi:GR25 family glycosyltransferase involved in LPS biosynthesis